MRWDIYARSEIDIVSDIHDIARYRYCGFMTRRWCHFLWKPSKRWSKSEKWVVFERNNEIAYFTEMKWIMEVAKSGSCGIIFSDWSETKGVKFAINYYFCNLILVIRWYFLVSKQYTHFYFPLLCHKLINNQICWARNFLFTMVAAISKILIRHFHKHVYCKFVSHFT